VLRIEDGARRLQMLRWGFAGGGRGVHINARADTAPFKPTFRDAYVLRRCVVPADGFYEWKGEQPFWFHRGDGRLLLFAGLWDGDRFLVLTTEPNALLREVHDRMPVVLAADDAAAWLVEPSQKLLRPCPDELLVAQPVSTRVNSVKHDDPACLDPPSPGGQLALFRV
jgi:putative SOS response-associated peptidase YedK